jgi:type II secretory pathway component GspD/PulD (secretin)
MLSRSILGWAFILFVTASGLAQETPPASEAAPKSEVPAKPQGPGIQRVRVLQIDKADRGKIDEMLQKLDGKVKVERIGEVNEEIRTGRNTEDVAKVRELVQTQERRRAAQANAETPAPAEPPAAVPLPAGPRVTKVFRLRTPAADIVKTFRTLFPTVVMASEPINNVLIASGAAEDLEIIEALVQQLDASPARIRISAIVAELPSSEKWEPQGDFAQASKQLEEFAAKGGGLILRRMQVSTLDNQVATVQLGEQVSVPSGASRTPRGEMQTVFTREQVGTMFTCTARQNPDGGVTMEFSFEMSRFLPPATKSEPEAAAAQAAATVTPQKQVATLRSSIEIPKDKAVSLTDFATQDAGAPTRLILLLGATAQ